MFAVIRLLAGSAAAHNHPIYAADASSGAPAVPYAVHGPPTIIFHALSRRSASFACVRNIQPAPVGSGEGDRTGILTRCYRSMTCWHFKSMRAVGQKCAQVVWESQLTLKTFATTTRTKKNIFLYLKDTTRSLPLLTGSRAAKSICPASTLDLFACETDLCSLIDHLYCMGTLFTKKFKTSRLQGCQPTG